MCPVVMQIHRMITCKSCDKATVQRASAHLLDVVNDQAEDVQRRAILRRRLLQVRKPHDQFKSIHRGPLPGWTDRAFANSGKPCRQTGICHAV
jgi:hypothetical protein